MDASRDQNRVTTLMGVSSADGVTPLEVQVDPTTGAILVDISGGGSGDVVGPGTATDNAIARFDSTTGKLLQNSGITISDADVVAGATINGSANTLDVRLASDVSGNLPVGNLNSGTSASAATFWRGDGTWASPSGSGDVVGPASATDNAIVRYDSTTGKLVQNSVVTVADTTGVIAGTEGVTFSGTTSGTTALVATAAAGTTTLTLPAATDTLVGKATTDTFTNKTFDANGTGNSISNVDLSADVTGDLPVTNLNGGTGASSSTFWTGDGTWSTPAGSGDVSKVGTPVNNQVGVWTGDGTIEGTSGLTYDGSNFQLTGDIGATGSRITKGWFTDLQVTNAIAGSITGNAATVTTITGLAPDTATTQATQPNITSLGTLTALQVDNININLNTISSTAGTDLLITPLAGQQIVLDGTIVVDAGVVTGATSITSTTFVGDMTGNADTATALATARTIGGTSFDGTANIVPGTITVADESVDTTCFPLFVTSATGDLGPKSAAGLTFNSSTDVLSATGFSGPLTGNVTGNASGTAATVTGATQAAITTTSNLVTVGTLTSGNADAIVSAASLTVAGKIEIATIAETNTGTDATRAVSPDGLDGWTGSAQVVTVGTLSSGDVDAAVSASSVTVAGKVELATTAEIDTGTDSTRAMPVDQFVASKRNIRWLVFNVVDRLTDCSVLANVGGDFVSPIAGTILQSDTTPFYLYATNSTAGTTGTMVVDIHLGGTTIMTTNKLDFDSTEKTTTTAATPPDLTDTTIAVGDILTIDIDAIHTTAAKGLTVYMAIRE